MLISFEWNNVYKMKPNIIFILFDDLGTNMVDTPQGRELGLYDGRPQSIKTPQMNDLASKGVFFSRNLASVPVCMPSRYSFLTGIRAGSKWSRVRGNSGVNEDADLHSAGEISIAMELKRSGYATAMFGKYHFRSDPSDGGFDYALHMTRFSNKDFPRYFPKWINEDSGNGNVETNSYTSKNVQLGISSYQEETNKCNKKGDACEYAPDIYHGESLKWMENQIDNGVPFFCYLPFLAPHDAKQTLLPVPRTDGPIVNYDNSEYSGYFGKMRQLASSITNYADVRIGEIRDFLTNKGVSDNTMIIITSDNGGTDAIASTTAQSNLILSSPSGYGANLPYRGKKRHLLLGGTSVPTIVYWPTKIPANGTLKYPTEMADISRTILEVAEVSNINEQFNGINIFGDLQNVNNPSYQSELTQRNYIVNEICLFDSAELGKHSNCDFMITFTGEMCNGIRVEWTQRSAGEYDLTILDKGSGYTSKNGGILGNLTLSDLRINGYVPFVSNISLDISESQNKASPGQITPEIENCISNAEYIILEYRNVPTELEINYKIDEYNNYVYPTPTNIPTINNNHTYSPSISSAQDSSSEHTIIVVVVVCCMILIIFSGVLVFIRKRRYRRVGNIDISSKIPYRIVYDFIK